MDLSLHGSHINLATRLKPKPACIKYPTLQRPCSANVSQYPRTFSLLRRPMSADEKLTRSLKNCVKFSEQVMADEQLWKDKKFLSTSSSNLFKLLLEEPISRSYYPQDTETLSDSSLGQKISDFAMKQGQSEKVEAPECDSKVEGRQKCNKVEEMNQDQADADSSTAPTEPIDELQTTLNNSTSCSANAPNTDLSTSQNKSGDFWHETKPDLPGRVSFGKTETYEIEVPPYEDPLPADVSTSTKKCVHFKETEETIIESNECFNDSTTSTCESNATFNVRPDSSSGKCRCPFACSSSGYLTISDNESNTNILNEATPSVQESNLIIEEYKRELGKHEKSVQLELKPLEKKSNTNSSSESSSDSLITSYQKLANEIFEDIQADLILSSDKSLDYMEQNDLSLPSKRKNNLTTERVEKSDISSESTISQFETLRHFPETSTNVIKNYLRATELKSAPTNHRRVKESNIGANKTENKSEKNRRTKSANANSTSASTCKNPTPGVMKKSPTFSCLRQDSNLDEFQIEKVDSWMSLHESREEYKDPPDVESLDKKIQQKKRKNFIRYKDKEESKMKSPEDSSQDDSTYEEILSVVKEIEEDEKQEATASQADVHLKLHPAPTTPESECMAAPKAERDSSPDKYRDILHYLDNVESSCDKTIMETRRSLPDSTRSEIEFPIETDIVEDVPKLGDLLVLPSHHLARKIVALTLRANELSNAIQLSKQHVAHIRMERQKTLRQEKSNSTNRLKEQKKYYESIVTRHQGFIEQLLKDKGSLCEKVTALTRRIESQNQAWEHKLETELVRAKETALAGEKIRREKWIRDNTKKIKELTVKGLEMEINRMTCQHQKEMTELKRAHQQELLDVVAEERQKYEQQEKAIRESCTLDRELSISKERDAIRERFEKQLREEQRSFDEHRSKLLEEFALERERLCAEMKHKELEYESKKQELLKEKELAIEQVRNELKEKCQKQEQKYQARISAIEKQFESDFLIWKREFENACKLREVENENAIRQHYRCERDRQIDAIVAKMDSETLRCHEDYDLKLSRIKEKYESELQQAEFSEKQLKDKFNDARNKLAECEARVQNYQAEAKQLSMELVYSKKMCDKLMEEKEIMKENARREVQQEIATLQNERDSEIEKIYQRVQHAIEKKDTAMDLLQKDNAALRERCIKLEAIIRQQRKDYCIK